MSSKQIKVSDTFEQSTCGVCGCCEINQYFTINDNFIEYSGIFLSLREVLKEALDLRVSLVVKMCFEVKLTNILCYRLTQSSSKYAWTAKIR